MKLNAGMEHRVISGHRAGGLTLGEIARRFASPLTEEHAWAVCHQCAKRLLQLKDALLSVLDQLSLNSVVVSVEGTVELPVARHARGSTSGTWVDYELTATSGR